MSGSEELESIAVALWHLWADVSPRAATSPGPTDQRFSDLISRIRKVSAGRDLTAYDVRDSYVLLLEQGVPTDEERQFIADYLNGIARPAVEPESGS